jgi:hypothetical protein
MQSVLASARYGSEVLAETIDVKELDWQYK